jgi:gluconate 2-dehydrogenase gamma chain
MGTTRREALVQIAMTPLAAAQQPSHPAHGPAGPKPPGPHRRRYFSEHEFLTLQALSDLIIPPDGRSGGGKAAGTAEFIDVMAADDKDLRTAFSGGLAWLDREMRARHGKAFRECGAGDQKAMLDQLAWRSKAPAHLAPGVRFFALMRQWTVDAFYSSREGVKDLGFAGNTAVAEFNGCPDEVVKKLLDASPV